MSVAAGARPHKLPPFFENQNKVVCAMAVQTKLFFVLQVCALIFIVNVTEGVERSKHGCLICGKKSQKTPLRSVDRQSNADLEACFGFVGKTSGDICEACRKVLHQYRNNGKTFHHVSVFLTFNSFNLAYTCDVKIKIERYCVQLELYRSVIFSLIVPSFICKQVNDNVKQTFSVDLQCRILLKFSIYLLFKVCSVESQPPRTSSEEKRTSNVSVRF